MAITVYLANNLLNHAFRNENIYVGLLDDAGAEITGYDGNRKLVTFAAPATIGGKPTVASDAVILFDEMPAVKVKAVIICDAATGDNILSVVPLVDNEGVETEVVVNEGQTFRLKAGHLTADFVDVEPEEE